MNKAISSNIGYPRIGEKREWKKALESFWKEEITEDALIKELETLRLKDLQKQKKLGIDLIPVGDFSYYDHVLDTAVMFGFIPRRFLTSEKKSHLQTYFDIARGNKDAVASEMTKWFNTNYHYIVPEIEEGTEPKLTENRPLHYYLEAKEKLGINGKPVLLGPFTFLKLAKGYKQEELKGLLDALIPLYIQVLQELDNAGAEWIQIDEPILSTTLNETDLKHLKEVYQQLNNGCPEAKILLQTYFEAVDHFEDITSLPVHGIGLDFIHDNGVNLACLKKLGFPKNKTLAAGLINGRNVWRSDLQASWNQLEAIRSKVSDDQLIIQPSCSLLHVPVTTSSEEDVEASLKGALAFADQKLEEISLLTNGINNGWEYIDTVVEKQTKNLKRFWELSHRRNSEVQAEVDKWHDKEPTRNLPFAERQQVQQDYFNLPLLPTTTIGSLPQTNEIRQARSRYRKGRQSTEDYENFIKAKTSEWIDRQEKIGLDVLVHGEFERNDMVEYFGEKLDGFAFLNYAWVQSYGSRCVKPPIIYGDVDLPEPMTVKEITYAQSLTDKPVKGMLTGPITIFNWSFVREDISPFEVTKQIALALSKEVQHLEKSGIHMIQVDEPALREGLPLKRDKQTQYLDEAVYAFKLSTSSVKNETQVHTHMCYSEFGEIIHTISQLDADVISIEAARSHGELIADFEKFSYDKGIGLGVYDIHSPRVPNVEEMERSITRALQVLNPRQFWVNPDCGLKTRGMEETTESLNNMVEAAHLVREKHVSHINEE